MNVFAKSDEIQSMILQDTKETKRNGQSHGRKDGQRENSIPSHKHSLRGFKNISISSAHSQKNKIEKRSLITLFKSIYVRP